MFRRRRSSSYTQPPLNLHETISAQSAASHAFLRSQPSTSSLSSAAAVTALRTATPNPTPIENVQTKRMLKRQSSRSSQFGRSSSVRSASRNGLRRSGSVSSMSSRTFRDGSPRRRGSISSQADDNASLFQSPAPSTFDTKKTTSLNRRSSSVDTPRRTEFLPATRQPRHSTRSASVGRVDRFPDGPSSSYISRAANRLSTVHEVEKPENRESVVFPSSNDTPQNSSFHDNNVPREPPPIPSQPLPNETTKKVRRSASHAGVFRNGAKTQWNMERGYSPGRRPVGTTAVAAAQTARFRQDSPLPPAGHTRNLARADNELSSPTRATAGGRAINTAQKLPPSRIPKKKHSNLRINNNKELAPKSGVHTERPRVADRELASPSPAMNDEVVKDGNNRATEQPVVKVSQAPVKQDGHGRSSDQTFAPAGSHKPAEKASSNGEPHTPQPSSPGRSAHFANHVSLTETLENMHKPPPRPMSLVKSALKHSPRDTLFPDLRPLQSPSEMSDVTSVASDDGWRIDTKKRRMKVSFDDEAEIMGVAASPPTSPEELAPPDLDKDKKEKGKEKEREKEREREREREKEKEKAKPKTHWFGVGKRKRVQLDGFDDDELNQVLRPRPVLPSFDSIRDVRDMEQPHASKEYPSDNESRHSLMSDTAIDRISFKDHYAGDFSPYSQREKLRGFEELPNGLSNPDVESAESAKSLERTATPNQDWNANVSNVPIIRIDSELPASDFDQKNENENASPSLKDLPSEPNTVETVETVEEPKSPELAIASEPGSWEPEHGDEKYDMDDTFDFDLHRMPGEFPPMPTDDVLEAVAGRARNVGQSHMDESEEFRLPVPTSNGNKPSSNYSSSSVYSDAAESMAVSKSRERGFSLRFGDPDDEVGSKSSERQFPSRLGDPNGKADSKPRERQLLSRFEDSDGKVGSKSRERQFTSRFGDPGDEVGPKPREYLFPSRFGNPDDGVGSKPRQRQFPSRFGDSDDEQDSTYQHQFYSRFDDSSDENETPGKGDTLSSGPVRGIPRRHDAYDGDSTDLEDSSEEEADSPPPPPSGKTLQASAMAAVARSRGMTVEQLETFLNRSPRGRGIGGFFRRLNMKRTKSLEVREPKSAINNDKNATSTLATDGDTAVRRQQQSLSNRESEQQQQQQQPAQTEDGAVADSRNGYNRAALDVVIAPTSSTPVRKRRFPRLRRLLGLKT